MEKEAHTFFAEWTQSLDAINNPDLRKRSQDRLNDTRLRYNDILKIGRQAGGEFDAFVGSLRDQYVYLGYDLNPAALASLSGDAKQLNAQAPPRCSTRSTRRTGWPRSTSLRFSRRKHQVSGNHRPSLTALLREECFGFGLR